MDKNEQITPAMILGGLLLHEALIAVLYVDHIENDKNDAALGRLSRNPSKYFKRMSSITLTFIRLI